MASIEDLLSTVSLDDLATLATIKSAGMDLGTGKRDVELNDPLVYTTYSAEDVPLPEGTEVIVEGSPLNQKEILVQTDQPTGFGRFLAGLSDIVSGNKYDYDRRDRMPLEEFQQKEILKQKRKADLSGDALSSPEQTRKRIESQKLQDAYLFETLKKLNNYELERFKSSYPQLARVINDEILKRRLQVEYNSPREIQERMSSARRNYTNALLTRSQAQANIANAVASGLGRYSGIRVT